MSFLAWQKPNWMPRLLAFPVPEPLEQAARILAVQRNIVLPARGTVTAVVLYYLFYSHWLDEANSPRKQDFEMLQHYFILYIIVSALSAIMLTVKGFPPRLVQWVVFTMGLFDGILLTGLTIETGGFGSDLYWVFPGLIVLNALSIPLATPQIVLNLALSVFFIAAGLEDVHLREEDTRPRAPELPRTLAKFSASEFRNLPAWAGELSQNADPVSAFLWSTFSAGLRQQLLSLVRNGHEDLARSNNSTVRIPNDTIRSNNVPGIGTDHTTQVALLLARELSSLVTTNMIYDPERFAGVKLSEKTRNLANQYSKSDHSILKKGMLLRLNRALLEETYPDSIVFKTRRNMTAEEYKKFEQQLDVPEPGAEPFLLRLIILWLLTASCYGVQLLSFRNRQAERDAREAEARNSELKTAGRLAAEIAHQLKNPLGIINNAAFSLQRGAREKRDISQQVEIIREEIERADQIITQLMGYAQLSEGRVEKLVVTEEIDHAIQEVLPAGASFSVEVERNYGEHLPELMMQRSHLRAVLVNILQNAREVTRGQGKITVTTRSQGENAVEISIEDSGPGIPPESLNRVFEAYYTSREKGTGLGLAIVKHNVELYGGSVRAESDPGKGARFILLFPARIFVQ